VDAIVIINPISGVHGIGVDRRVAMASQSLDHARLTGTVEVTASAGHGPELAAAAVGRGIDRVVVWGGDGTINEILPAVADTGVGLGIIPGGSGNGLARQLGLPLEPRTAFRIALGNRKKIIDLGECEGRLFANVAGLGFDARIADLFGRAGKRGTWTYITEALRELFAYRASTYRLSIDAGAAEESTALIVAFANSGQYGSGAYIAPGARPDDGELDLVIVGDRGRLGRMAIAVRFLTTTIDKAWGVSTQRVRRVSVGGSEPMLFHADGEPVWADPPLAVGVRPGALTLFV